MDHNHFSNPLFPQPKGGATRNLSNIGPEASEEKWFENVNGWMDARTKSNHNNSSWAYSGELKTILWYLETLWQTKQQDLKIPTDT